MTTLPNKDLLRVDELKNRVDFLTSALREIAESFPWVTTQPTLFPYHVVKNIAIKALEKIHDNPSR